MNYTEREYVAHISKDGKRQSVHDHCENTGSWAKDCLASVSLGETAYLAGLAHDMGKAQEPFQHYLERTVKGENVRRGSVIHTFQGCRMLLENFHGQNQPDEYKKVTTELLAYAVGAHHGLFDCLGEDKKCGFLHRMKQRDAEYEAGYQDALGYFLSQCGGMAEVEKLFHSAHCELLPIYERLIYLSEENGDDSGAEISFYVGMLARLILSAVIEGDRRDTASFLDGTVFPERPQDRTSLQALWERRLRHMEEKLAALRSETPIGQARYEISELCRTFGERGGGCYRLNVPTGAGKTLASLRYALSHAAKWGKRRIIFTAPLLTILDQNAQEIRKYIGADGLVKELILEHHSDIVRSKKDTDDELDYWELLAETWDAPVIITTMVQLLNTLFDGRTTAIRRFQALCDSVIIIDEVQAIPTRMLTLFNLAVNFLSGICGVTFVLCSATQPCLEKTPHPLLLGSVKSRRQIDIVPYSSELWEPFRRTRIVHVSGRVLNEIPTFVTDAMEDIQSLLVVCNMRKQAEYLYRVLSGNRDITCFHLSASMCMAHRKKVLIELRRALAHQTESRRKVLCISTQVIQAGVDISFQRAMRLTAGMDDVVQTAGRCNRNGESLDLGEVYVMDCIGEDLSRLPDIQASKKAAQDLMSVYEKNPANFKKDLASDEAIVYYYRRLYQGIGDKTDYYVKHGEPSLFSLLSGNTQYRGEGSEWDESYTLAQAFKKAGTLFQVFDDDTVDVIVPYGEGVKIIADLSQLGTQPNASDLSALLERAKPYTISLYENQKKQLGTDGLYDIGGILVLRPGYYDENTGLTLKQGKLDFWEV